MAVFNVSGVIITVAGFLIAYGAGRLLGISAEGPLMIMAAPLLIVLDLAWRGRTMPRRWFHAESGGSLVYLPVWIWGLVWGILGLYDTVKAH